MLQAIDICKTFQDILALRAVNLHIEEGEFVSVVGRSGSGKSTLLAVCSTLLAPDSGQLIYKGQSVSDRDADGLNQLRHTDFSVIFQFHHLMPYLTAEENTLLPFMNAYRPIPRRRNSQGARMP